MVFGCVPNRCHGTGRLADLLEPVGQLQNMIAVAHQHRLLGRKPVKKWGSGVNRDGGLSVFLALGRFNLAATVVHQPLHAVADTKQGLVQRQYLRVEVGGVGLKNTVRTAGQNERAELIQLADGGRQRQDFAIDV